MDQNVQVRIAEMIAASIVVFSMLRGYHIGLIKTLFSMVRLILTILISLFLTPVIIVLIPQTGVARYGTAYLVSLLITVILLAVVSRMLSIINHIPVLKTINRVTGALVGILLGFITLWLIIMIIGTFQELEWCEFAAALVRQSKLLTFIKELNPILTILDVLGFPII